jgi:benzoylformate decarboxylase
VGVVSAVPDSWGATEGRPGKVAVHEQWEADGVRFMFGNPGTVEQGFLDTLEQSSIQYVLALQETVAVGIADGYARATGGPALVQLHSGVGLGNGIGMIYQAKRGHSPLVVVAGESGIAYDAMDAQMASDLVAMARPVVKYATRVVHPQSVLRVLRRAMKIAMTPPRGPVFVSLPMDVLDALTAEPALPSSIPTRRVAPAPAELDAAVEILATASRPVILVGDGVAASGAQAELARVAELLDAVVYAVDAGELNLDMTHPLYGGQLGHMFGTVSAKAVADADAALVVGTYLFPEVFPSLVNPFAPGARTVHIDLDDYELAKNFPVDVPLVADPRTTLAALADRLAGTPHPSGGTRQERRARTDYSGPAEPVPPGPDAGLAELFAAEVRRQAPAELLVFDEALTTSPAVSSQLAGHTPGSYFLTRGGSLGVGLPGAIGVKLARPEAEVIGFTGDGGSMYTYQCLWTAARYGINARFVICNNHRYRLLDDNIDQYWRERDIPEHAFPSGFDLAEPEIDFSALARALSVPALRVDKPDQIEAAVTAMFASAQPFLIDLVTE